MSGHILPCPPSDWDAREGVREVAEEAKARGEMTLEMVWSHTLYHALMSLARRQRKEVSLLFSVGAALWSAIQAREALERIERESLLPMCDFDAGTDSLYEELEALGRSAPEHF